MTIRRRGDQRQGMACTSAADVDDCIMVRIRTESTEYKGVARSSQWRAPLGSSAGYRQRYRTAGQFRELAPRAQASRRCATQAALRRQAAPLTPSAHAVNPIA